MKASSQKIIKADEFESLLKADELLEQAREQAAKILADATTEANHVKSRAVTEANQQRKRGHAEGWASAQREFAAKMTSSQTAQAKDASQLDERIAILVTNTLSKVLTEQECNEKFFSSVVRRVIRAAREEKFLTLRVHPSQHSAAQKSVAQVVEQTQATNFIEVIPDRTLKTGSCIVESATGVIDASLDTQLETIRSALTSVWTHPDERKI